MNRLADSPFNKGRCFLLGSGAGRTPFEQKPDGTMDDARPNARSDDEVEYGLRNLRTLGVEADLILFTPYGAPGIIRFVNVDAAPAGAQVADVSELGRRRQQ